MYKPAKYIFVFLITSCSDRKNTYPEIEYRTRKELQFLSMCIDAYFRQTGEVPQSIFLATSEFDRQTPDRWKKAKETIDPWGYPYKMLKTPEGFQIWSFGRNNIDENGSGDDIVRTWK